MRGRKPKPTEIHELNGNPSKINIEKRQVAEIHPDGIPSCPDWLDRIGRTEWRRICPDLIKLKLLTKIDRAALTGYCAAYSRWVRAEKALISADKDSTGLTLGKIKRTALPEVKIAEAALNQVRQFCAEFGLTPSSRARMAIPGKKDDDADEMEKFLEATNKKARKVL
jgi:P27 family predicted phage terminase small subunit